MRVPDQIKKAVVFLGLDNRYRGTGYIVTVPDGYLSYTDPVTAESNPISVPQSFLVTAAHVAEQLEGRNFLIRANGIGGKVRTINAGPDCKWWYHPDEIPGQKKQVDSAVTIFPAGELPHIDVAPIPLFMFADSEIIKESDLGIGDEVFITGLFTGVVETSKNIPIVRTGNVAMMPDEKIPFGDHLIEAYLIESRSIGGLSGSPVFIKETITRREIRLKPGVKLNSGTGDKYPGQSVDVIGVQGTGRFFFFGSIIGHWKVPVGFTLTEAEAVNMGIAPVVPAHKISEIIVQDDLMKTIMSE
jgi:hypothetical protein